MQILLTKFAYLILLKFVYIFGTYELNEITTFCYISAFNNRLQN